MILTDFVRKDMKEMEYSDYEALLEYGGLYLINLYLSYAFSYLRKFWDR